MEFEELQKIWMAEGQQFVYAINEEALHNRIISKKKKTLHIANASELLLIIVNFCTGCFVFGVNYWNNKGNIFMYIMAAWMFVTVVYVVVHRIRRLQEQPKFDRSIREDLQHAIATATYQVRLSHIMRLNIIPIGALSLLGVWEGNKSIWFTICLLLFFWIAYYFSGWEHGIYKNKKRELELLQSKLEQE